MYPVSVLKDLNIDFKGLFYNPNIHPIDEYEKRRENALKASQNDGYELFIEDDYQEELWRNYNIENPTRCEMCYSKRLEKVVQYAVENGFDSFTTSLLVSPYQNHEFIVSQSQHLAQKYNINFFYKDFRPGFREGQARAKEIGLYRQKYCGCIKSLP